MPQSPEDVLKKYLVPPAKGVFHTEFDRFQEDFKKQFGRPFTVTSEDVGFRGLHLKLHGGKAKDIRVRGLSPQEKEWVLKEAPKRGFDIRDFSSGRVGTGPHIHVDRGGESDEEMVMRKYLVPVAPAQAEPEEEPVARLSVTQEADIPVKPDIGRLAGATPDVAGMAQVGMGQYRGVVVPKGIYVGDLDPDSPTIQADILTRLVNELSKEHGLSLAEIHQVLGPMAFRRPLGRMMGFEEELSRKAGVGAAEISGALREADPSKWSIERTKENVRAAQASPEYRGWLPVGLPSDAELALRGFKKLKGYEGLTPKEKEAEALRISETRQLTSLEKQVLGVEESTLGTVRARMARAGGELIRGAGRAGKLLGEVPTPSGAKIKLPKVKSISEAVEKFGIDIQKASKEYEAVYGSKGSKAQVLGWIAEMAPEMAGSFLLPHGRLVQLPYWYGIMTTRALGRGEEWGKALQEGIQGVAMAELMFAPGRALRRGGRLPFFGYLTTSGKEARFVTPRLERVRTFEAPPTPFEVPEVIRLERRRLLKEFRDLSQEELERRLGLEGTNLAHEELVSRAANAEIRNKFPSEVAPELGQRTFEAPPRSLQGRVDVTPEEASEITLRGGVASKWGQRFRATPGARETTIPPPPGAPPQLASEIRPKWVPEEIARHLDPVVMIQMQRAGITGINLTETAGNVKELYDRKTGKVEIDKSRLREDVLQGEARQALNEDLAHATKHAEIEQGAPDVRREMERWADRNLGPEDASKAKASVQKDGWLGSEEWEEAFVTDQARQGTWRKMQEPGRVPIDPLPGGEMVSPYQIILNFGKVLGTRIKKGGMPRPLVGYYDPTTGLMKLRYRGDLDITAHEATHLLDHEHGILKDWAHSPDWSLPWDSELIPHFSYHGSGGPNVPFWYNRAEGVAEWVRAFMVNPQEAIARAPQFYAHFQAKVPAKRIAQLRKFGDDIRKWAGLPAEERQASNFHMEDPTLSLLQRMRKFARGEGYSFEITALDALQTRHLDSIHPVIKAIIYAKDLRGIDRLLPEDDPMILMRLWSGSPEKLNAILENGWIDAKNQRVTPGGLSWVLEPIWEATELMGGKTAADLQYHQQVLAGYMLAQRTPGLHLRLQKDVITGAGGGIFEELGQAADTLRNIYANPQLRALYDEAALRYRAAEDSLLWYWVQKGRMSKEEYLRIRNADEYYVAIPRVLEELEWVDYPTIMRRLGTPRFPVKLIKGGAGEIHNPYDTLILHTHLMIQEADRNAALRSFTELLHFPTKNIYERARVALGEIGEMVDNPADFKDAIKVWGRVGDLQRWKFESGVHKALKGWGEDAKLPLAVTFAAKLTRAGVVYSPPFIFRNAVRDAFSRSVISESGTKPWGVLKSIPQAEIEKMRLFGGLQAGHYMNSRVDYHKALKSSMHDLAKDRSTILTVPWKLAQGWKKVAQMSETIGRMDEAMAVYKKARASGMDDFNASLLAASEARGLIDYSIAGTWSRQINQIIPFYNPAIRGIDRAVKGILANPAGFARRWGLYVLAPTLLEYAWNAGAGKLDEWEAKGPFRQDLFWNFYVAPDLWLSVPKPFEIGVLASGVNRAITATRHMSKGMGTSDAMGKAFEGYLGSLQKSLLPIDQGVIAGPFKSILEMWANADFFRDMRPIVSPHEKELLLHKREGAQRASKFGIALSNVGGILSESLRVDPRYIDHFVESSFGSTGQLVTRASDIERRPFSSQRFASGFLGMVATSPLSGSKDFRGVMDAARKLGLLQSEQIRELRDMESKYYTATTREERARIAEEVRTKAARLRPKLEKQVKEELEKGKGGIPIR
jgi:tetratricopeptide (TPR) repeat protein